MPPSTRTTRISAACKACRARKHRCSGERPRCAQCTVNDVRCEWPVQQKRGPPKEYRTALETRLIETENVLLALLQEMSEAQLESGLLRLQTIRDGRTEDTGPSLWNDYPLQSAADVRRWADHAVIAQGDDPTSTLSSPNTSSAQRHESQGFDPDEEERGEPRISVGDSTMEVEDTEIMDQDVLDDDMGDAAAEETSSAGPRRVLGAIRGNRKGTTTQARRQEQQLPADDFDSAYLW